MKASSLKEQSDQELRQLLEETRKDLFAVKLKKASGDTSTPPMRARGLRRDAARILTVLRQRELKGHG